MSTIEGNSSTDAIPPELRAALDMEMVIEGLEEPTAQAKVNRVLEGLPGVESLIVQGESAAIRYDPEQVNHTQIREAVESAGFQITTAETAAVTPPIESAADASSE